MPLMQRGSRYHWRPCTALLLCFKARQNRPALLSFLTTMQDEQRFNLLFGPYHPPKTRRGKFLFCEMRGTVKVGDYSDGPIPWPVKWGTRNSLILCGDL